MVYKLTEQELLMKNWRELLYVQYLLHLKDEVCRRWIGRIKTEAENQQMGTKGRNESYIPCYVNTDGKEVEMKEGDAKMEKFLGVDQLNLNHDGNDINLIFLMKGKAEVKLKI